MLKNENWKQNSPIDQFIATRCAAEGSVDMAYDHIFNGNVERAFKMLEVSLILLKQLEELTEYLRKNPNEWS